MIKIDKDYKRQLKKDIYELGDKQRKRIIWWIKNYKNEKNNKNRL